MVLTLPHPNSPTYRRILGCFKGRINSLKAKKQAQAAPKAPQPQEPQLPKTAAPVAEPPVKFLSLTGSSSAAADLPGPVTRMYKQGSGGSGQSSSGIPVGPATGPAHGLTPWGESDQSLGRDQGMQLPVAPTAASLAAVAQQQGALYRDSNSFRLWAASAVQTQGGWVRCEVGWG